VATVYALLPAAEHNNYETGTSFAVFRLHRGDRVHVGQCNNIINISFASHGNIFSGILVKAD